MSKKHDAIFDDVLADLDADRPVPERAGTRFLKRSSTLAEQASGERQEKVLRLVDPAVCKMWDRHNRAYDLLTEENCRDLIDGILRQGRQEFPAVVRRLPAGQGAEYEVICGARRHFAISWLRANTYPQFQYLIEERDLTDEEAFRLADLENRDREDISDYERARDYAAAIELYYQGKQKLMAERLEVSEGFLSRYLQLARLPQEIVRAFPSLRDLKELHARQLRPLLSDPVSRDAVIGEARALDGQGLPASKVLSRLKAAGAPPKERRAADKTYRRNMSESGVQMRRKGKRVQLEFDAVLPDGALRAAVEAFIKDRRG